MKRKIKIISVRDDDSVELFQMRFLESEFLLSVFSMLNSCWELLWFLENRMSDKLKEGIKNLLGLVWDSHPLPPPESAVQLKLVDVRRLSRNRSKTPKPRISLQRQNLPKTRMEGVGRNFKFLLQFQILVEILQWRQRTNRRSRNQKFPRRATKSIRLHFNET